jgi:hypothetical protein
VDAVLRGEKTATAGLAEEEEPVQAGERLALLGYDDEPIGIERFFERPLPDDTLIDAVRFRLVERL